MKTLSKQDIQEKITYKMGFSRKQSTQIVEDLIEIMKAAMEDGEDVLISGFGKFCVADKKERKGRNPATGEDLMLSKRRVVTFKCSEKLRDAVNNGKKG